MTVSSTDAVRKVHLLESTGRAYGAVRPTPLQ